MLTLRGIDFGTVCNASGAQGFFGEGYPYHRAWKLAGLTFEGVTFTAKTATWEPRLGNMPLKADRITPNQLFPPCIKVYPFQGIALNAVGLSGPGFPWLLSQGRWQQRTEPFFISFMAVGTTPEERLRETASFVAHFLAEGGTDGFKGPLGLEYNVSCPNVGLDPTELVIEVNQSLDLLLRLNVPVVPKINLLVPIEVAAELGRHPACDGLCLTNTIPWGKMPDRIDWQRLFGTAVSPLEKFGGGGLSGAPLHPLVVEYVSGLRGYGFSKPINAGGGVLSARDALELLEAGADAVSISSMAMLRPFNMRSTIAAVRRGGARR